MKKNHTIKLFPVDEGVFSEGQMRLAAMEDDTLVGCVDLYNYDPVHRRAEVGIVVVKQFRHQGVGAAILNQLTSFCATSLSLHQLYCDIAAVNSASLKLFEHCGYVRCGLMKEWLLVAGRYVDSVRLQLMLDSVEGGCSDL